MIQIYKTMGGYNLIALVVAEDLDTLESISIDKCSERLRHKEIRVLPHRGYPFLTIPPDKRSSHHKNMRIAPCNVDCKPCTRFIDGKCTYGSKILKVKICEISAGLSVKRY